MADFLTGLLPDELAEQLQLAPSYRGKQVFSWIQRGIDSFENMTNLSKNLRESLKSAYPHIFSSSIDTVQKDEADGTVKISLRLHDGQLIEAVLLQDGKGRKTACISSQAGCAMGCTFCRTGTMGLIRNLSAAEIIEQCLILNAEFGPVSHIVYMGMGEPLGNTDAVRRSAEILHHPEGLNISFRKMTISTCGIVPGIRELADAGPHVRLALSLTSARPEIRTQLMPINKRYPQHAVRKALLYYQQQFSKRLTLEYVLLKGVNDTKQDVQALAAFAEGLQVVVNLIPWNPGAQLAFREPSEADVERMSRQIEQAGLSVTRRYRKGRSIDGACGQLATAGKNIETAKQE